MREKSGEICPNCGTEMITCSAYYQNVIWCEECGTMSDDDGWEIPNLAQQLEQDDKID